MNVELITREDLKQFKNEMLTEMKHLLKPGQGQSKQWLKSYEVRKLLNISPGTLQNLRVNGTLRYTKIGGLLYYKFEDIEKLLEGNSKWGKKEQSLCEASEKARGKNQSEAVVNGGAAYRLRYSGMAVYIDRRPLNKPICR